MLASLYGKLTVTFNSRQWKQEAEIPRNGAGVASPVPGFNTVAASTTILSALHNSGINDIFTILNSAWPVSLGGTGGTTSITSWDAITAKGTDIASASTIVLTTATGPRIDITGTTAITAVTLANGSIRIARATGIFVLTASATLLVNKSASVNYTTAVGDLMIFTAEGGVTSVTVIGSSSASSTTTSNAPFINLSLVASVAASALTVAIKGVDGNDPSASNPVTVNFRSATAGSGAVAQLTLTAATSIVISSGSTMGFTSAVIGRLWLVGFNDAGTFRLGLVNCLSGTSIMALRPGIYSSTAEGGAGAADSAQVIYTGTAVTSKAMIILGYLEATEATAGTWATAPSLVKVYQPGDPMPGDRVGSVFSGSSSVATGTTIMPSDNTTPQNTEGTQFMAITYVPQMAPNLLEVEVEAIHATSAVLLLGDALFRDSTANAIAAMLQYSNSASATYKHRMKWPILAASTASTTFKYRSGPHSAGTVYFNSDGGSSYFNGLQNSFMQITEIMA